MTSEDLEKQLAELTAERERRQAERDEAAKARRLAERIERQKRAMADDETMAKLVEEYGEGNVQRINTPHGMVVVRVPEPIVYDRFQDQMNRSEHPNPKVRTSAAEAALKFARHSLAYPSIPEFDALCKKVPSLAVVAANEAASLGKAQAADDEGK